MDKIGIFKELNYYIIIYYIYPLNSTCKTQLNSACLIKGRTDAVVVFENKSLEAGITQLHKRHVI